jgi:hypothetical protein
MAGAGPFDFPSAFLTSSLHVLCISRSLLPLPPSSTFNLLDLQPRLSLFQTSTPFRRIPSLSTLAVCYNTPATSDRRFSRRYKLRPNGPTSDSGIQLLSEFFLRPVAR